MFDVSRILAIAGILTVGLGTSLAQEERGGRRGRPEEGGPGRWGGPMRGGGEMRFPEELQEFLEDFMPGRVEELARLRRTNMNQFREMMGQIMRQKRELDELRERDPDEYERRRSQILLDVESRELVEQVRRTENEEAKQAAKEKLTEIVSQQFEYQCEDIEKRVEALTEQIQKMKELLEKRRASKEKIVLRRVDELCGDDAHLRWNIGQQNREQRAQRQEGRQRGFERRGGGFGPR